MVSPVAQGLPNGFAPAIDDIEDAFIIADVRPAAEIAYERAKALKKCGELKDDRMSVDGVGALRMYTSENTTPPVYQDMNSKLKLGDRTLIAPYLKFIWLLLKSMLQIDPVVQSTVYRGVKADLSADYPPDTEFVWHGFSSCTMTSQVLFENEKFCGKTGPRTIFEIELTQGQARDIKRFSSFPAEDEVLLPPGCKFKVMRTLDVGPFVIVYLEELPSMDWIMDLSRNGFPGFPPLPLTFDSGVPIRTLEDIETAIATKLGILRPLGNFRLVGPSRYLFQDPWSGGYAETQVEVWADVWPVPTVCMTLDLQTGEWRLA